MTPDQFEVVIVPFPFVDTARLKRRPAVVLSAVTFNQHGMSILAMITAASHSVWPGDIVLDYLAAGLPKPCVARLKIFTIDNRFIEEKRGRLSNTDIAKIKQELSRYVPC